MKENWKNMVAKLNFEKTKQLMKTRNIILILFWSFSSICFAQPVSKEKAAQTGMSTGSGDHVIESNKEVQALREGS